MKKNETEKELPRPCAKCRRGQEGLCNCNYWAVRGIPAKGLLTTLTQPYIYALIFNL